MPAETAVDNNGLEGSHWDGKPHPADLARALYAALAAGDRAQLDALLHPEFTGRTAEGMPFGIGGDHHGPAAMRRNGWGAIARHFEARAEPEGSSISPTAACW